VLPYLIDVKLIGACLPYGLQKFEQKEEVDWRAYSEKIRGLLKEHLDVTGLAQHLKTHALTDPAFWDDFEDPKDLKTAAVRKLTELKKETSERAASNPARYESFSQRVKELIEEFQKGLFDDEGALERAKAIAEGVREEDGAHEGSGLSERAYGVAKILEKFQPPAPGVAEPEEPSYGGGGGGEKPLSEVERAAAAIDALYASDQTAPTYWQDKEVLKKELRGQVRRILQPLGLPGWQKDIPLEVEHYAVRHYRKP
jgi:type I restriction enzyme R subunit